MNVKDKIYKVINEHWQAPLRVEEFQILRIRRHGRLDCFRTNGKDISKAQWHFNQDEVGITPEEAVLKAEKLLNVKIANSQKELQLLLEQKQQLCILAL